MQAMTSGAEPGRPGPEATADGPDKHELARAGRLSTTIRCDRGQIERLGDRLDAHHAPPGQRPAWPTEAPGLGSVCVSLSSVRRRSRATAGRLSGLVRDAGGRW